MDSAVFDAFMCRWQSPPAILTRAPGRVNLIGEHIDYEGYGVLPMAIQQACYAAAGWQQPDASSACPPQAACCSLKAANLQPDLYPAAELVQLSVPILPDGTPPWLKYIHAAYKGCSEFAASKQQDTPCHGCILLMVGSTIPPAAGLSSSSALVVATALALLELWQVPHTPSEVADITCRCERFVGTQGGGMDQAVSLLAQAGQALHVDFNPIQVTPVTLPEGAVFVVANSLAQSAKAETATTRFNLRVLECRLAAMLLAHRLSEHGGGGGGSLLPWRRVSILKQVEPHLFKHMLTASGASTTGSSAGQGQLLSQAVQQLLPEACFTFTQVAEVLGVNEQQLQEALPQSLHAAATAATHFLLQQRACHVFTEAHRVLSFKDTCQTSQQTLVQKLQQLGTLLNASHTSCAELYQCSCEELDTLVNAARHAGALGARLTGAGWGGCIVALVPPDQVDSFMQQLMKQYYQPLVQQGVLAQQDVSGCLFASSPSAGASVMHYTLPDAHDSNPPKITPL